SSPHGPPTAAGSTDPPARLWNVLPRRPLGQALRGHTNTVWSVAFSPDGHALASAGADKTVRLWDVRTHTQLGGPLRTSSGIWSAALSPGGRAFATAGPGVAGPLSADDLWHISANLPPPRRPPVSRAL